MKTKNTTAIIPITEDPIRADVDFAEWHQMLQEVTGKSISVLPYPRQLYSGAVQAFNSITSLFSQLATPIGIDDLVNGEISPTRPLVLVQGRSSTDCWILYELSEVLEGSSYELSVILPRRWPIRKRK